MHPEKLSVHLEAFGFSTLFNTKNLSNFSHAPRKAQSVHLKAFGFSTRRTFPIFLMHPEKLKVYISKLLVFQHFSALRTCPFFLMHPEKLKAYISKLLAFQHCSTLRTFPIFSCTLRSSTCTSQSFWLVNTWAIFPIFRMHPKKLKAYISEFFDFQL